MVCIAVARDVTLVGVAGGWAAGHTLPHVGTLVGHELVPQDSGLLRAVGIGRIAVVARVLTLEGWLLTVLKTLRVALWSFPARIR